MPYHALQRESRLEMRKRGGRVREREREIEREGERKREGRGSRKKPKL
jgi:hypothetical protein